MYHLAFASPKLTDTLLSFLKMISVGKTGGTIQNFSSRFSLKGMTGTFPVNILNGIKKVSGTKGPSSIDQIIHAVGDEVEGDFDVPYNKQKGLTKYAPMQPVPKTKMKEGDNTPLNPPTSVPIATTFLPPAKIETTITKEQTFEERTETNTVSSHEIYLMHPTLTLNNRSRLLLTLTMTCKSF